jgi:hypothetical protein
VAGWLGRLDGSSAEWMDAAEAENVFAVYQQVFDWRLLSIAASARYNSSEEASW